MLSLPREIHRCPRTRATVHRARKRAATRLQRGSEGEHTRAYPLSRPILAPVQKEKLKDEV